jgi:hypothetical protein
MQVRVVGSNGEEDGRSNALIVSSLIDHHPRAAGR